MVNTTQAWKFFLPIMCRVFLSQLGAYSPSFRQKTLCHSLFSVLTSQSPEYDAKRVGVSEEHVFLDQQAFSSLQYCYMVLQFI